MREFCARIPEAGRAPRGLTIPHPTLVLTHNTGDIGLGLDQQGQSILHSQVTRRLCSGQEHPRPGSEWITLSRAMNLMGLCSYKYRNKYRDWNVLGFDADGCLCVSVCSLQHRPFIIHRQQSCQSIVNHKRQESHTRTSVIVIPSDHQSESILGHTDSVHCFSFLWTRPAV